MIGRKGWLRDWNIEWMNEYSGTEFIIKWMNEENIGWTAPTTAYLLKKHIEIIYKSIRENKLVDPLLHLKKKIKDKEYLEAQLKYLDTYNNISNNLNGHLFYYFLGRFLKNCCWPKIFTTRLLYTSIQISKEQEHF